MIVILAPAKTMELEIRDDINYSSRLFFKDETKILVNILQGYSKEHLRKFMKVSESIAELNFNRYKNFYNDNTNEYIAILGFKGQVYKAINASSFSVEDLNYSQSLIRILSGLYGVIKPLDMIKEYRLEMGSKLINEYGKDLYSFWGNKITSKIEDDLKASPGDKVLINLASKEYTSSVQLDKIRTTNQVIDIIFLEQNNGECKVIGTYAKKARGLMTRFIIINKIDTVEGIKQFSEDGYTYNKELSDDKNIIFIR